MEYFAAAKAAAYKIFEIIDRVPLIDSMSDEGHKPERVKGEIELRNVDFTYPSRTDVQVRFGGFMSKKIGGVFSSEIYEWDFEYALYTVTQKGKNQSLLMWCIEKLDGVANSDEKSHYDCVRPKTC